MAESLRLAAHPDLEALLLPRGDSQRARLMVAVNTLAAERGIVRTTVDDILREAGVSRATFYQAFRSKEDCMIASYRCAVDIALQASEAPITTSTTDDEPIRNWRDLLRTGVRIFLQALTTSPGFARATLLEIQHCGEPGLAARDEALHRFANVYRRLYDLAALQDPTLGTPTDDAIYIIAAGHDQLLAKYIRDGRGDQLTELEDTFVTSAAGVVLATASTPSA